MSDQTGATTDPDTRDVARQEKEQVKGTAKDAASNVGGSAKQRGRQLQGEAKSHARDLVHNAQSQLRGHAQEETQRAGSALSTAGDQLRALAEGRIDDAGRLGDYVEQAADAVTRWADTINDRGFDGLLDDLRSAGRRRPGVFLGGALLAGVLAGRFGRNVAQELGDDDGTALPGGDRTATAGGGGYGAADDRDRSEDMIVGYASDDQGVVVDPAGRTADDEASERPVAPRDEGTDDDLAYQPVDVDQGRRR